MSYVLNGITIRAPHQLKEGNSTQVAVQRTLSGAISRDYFGSNKRVWILDYQNTNKTDHDIIKAIYDLYLSSGQTKSWQVTETNYTVSLTNVHIDLLEREFSVKGSDYISSFTLTLTEA